MKKVLLASTAVAAFVALSGAAQAQDPGRADFGATEGGGNAGSAFTVTTSGAVKFYLKYASGSADRDLLVAAAPATDGDPTAEELLAEAAVAAANASAVKNTGFFTLVSAELEINGAATTDSGIDISTHVDLDFSGVRVDSARTVTIGGQEDDINVGDIVRVDELSLKIAGNFGSVELGANDGAEDTFKIYGATVAAATGGIDGDHHSVANGVGSGDLGGTAGSGDSSDDLKVTYLSPVIAGLQGGVSISYATNEGPADTNGGVLGVGVGAQYGRSDAGVDYAFSLVWGDTAITADTSAAEDANGYGGLGVGFKIAGAGASFATGVTIEDLGHDTKELDIDWSGGIAYAIGSSANVSLTSGIEFLDTGRGYEFERYIVFVSGDYTVLPGVTLALDLGYGESDINNPGNDGSGFTGVFRAKAAF